MRTKFSGMLTLLLAFVVQLTFAQEKTVAGTVFDDNGLPLPGVNVVVKGTNQGTQTDFDGNYSISTSADQTLVFSYQGFNTQQVLVGAQSTININMVTNIDTLNEVVVTGYASQNKETIASAVSIVSEEEIDSRPVGSFAQALQAQAPGLNIATGNGQPGGNSVVIIRGISSINGNTEPLFVIDGVPVDEDNFRSINPNDIKSATVLKDAAATAIYGNRATGGVIVIETKTGKRNEKFTMRYSGQTGVTLLQPTNFEVASSEQLLRIERAAGVGVGGGQNYGAFVQGQVGVIPGAPLTDAEIAQVAQTNTKWQDILLRTGEFSNHNLAFSGGGENSTLFTSLGYFEQEGIALRSGLQRMTFRTNFSLAVDDLKIDAKVSAGYSRSNFAGGIRQGTVSGSLSNPFITPYVSKPYLSPFNEDGSIDYQGDTDPANAAGFLNTPFIALNVSRYDLDQEEELKLIGSINGAYNITDNLTASAFFGLDVTDVTFKFIQPPGVSIRGRNLNDPNAEFQGGQQEGYSRDARLTLQSNLRYDKTFNDVHNFSAAAYTEFLYSDIGGFNYNQTGLIPGLVGTGAGFVSGNTTEDPDGDGVDNYFYIPGVGSFESFVSQFSYFGTMSYDYDSRFGVSGTLRRDASSRFNETNKWGTFYAAAAFWNLGKESFLEDSNVIDLLKLRVSYGQTGNDRVVGTYYGGLTIPFDLFNTGQAYNGTVGLFPSAIGNPDLKWETTTTANIGLDFGLFEGNLNGALELYDRETTDLFIGNPNTAISGGFTSINSNVGTLSNRGVELNLSWNILNNPDSDWFIKVGANGAYNKNEIEELPGVEENQFGETILFGNARATVAEGQPFNSFYNVRWAGVNPNDGTPLYYTRDGDITSEYRLEDRVFLDKSTVPVYQGGFNTEVAFKGFSLTTQWSWAAEVYRNNGNLGVIEDPGLIGIANVSPSLARAWTQPGQITDIPALNTGSVRNLLTDRYLEDASYLRIRNAVLGYNFQPNALDQLGLDSLRLYFQAENFLTFSGWRGFDPEFDPFVSNAFFAFPNPRTFTFGIDIKL